MQWLAVLLLAVLRLAVLRLAVVPAACPSPPSAKWGVHIYAPYAKT